MQFPLTITSKGQSAKRKVQIKDAGGQTICYAEFNVTNSHRKPTTVYADEKRKQATHQLTGKQEKQVVHYQATTAEGAPLGSLSLAGGFTRRDFELFDAAGASIGTISGEGVGRELVGAALGGLAGMAVRGKGAEYVIELPGNAAVGLTRIKGREARVDAEGEIPADLATLLALCLIPWAAFSLM